MSEPFTFGRRDALLVIDVINDFDHDDGDRLLASFHLALPMMARTIADARNARIPIIYVNDERGRWDSDALALVERALDSEKGFEIVRSLAPKPGDHFLLKHRYSAFDHMPLDLLLVELNVDRLVLIGAATDPELEATAVHYAERVVGAHISRGQ